MANKPYRFSLRNMILKSFAYALAHKAAAGIILGAVVVAAFGQKIANRFLYHQLTIELVSRRKPVGGVSILLFSDDLKDSVMRRTDGLGRCIFEGRHISRWSSPELGKWADEAFVLDQDTVIRVFLDRKITSPVPPPPLLAGEPHKDPHQLTCRMPEAVTIHPATDEPSGPDTMVAVGKPAGEWSANEVLGRLALAVRVDPADHYPHRKDLIAYHYRLVGQAAFLNRVRQVLYQRNEARFPENRADRFIVCGRRGGCFEYVGYQSADTYSAYVQIVLNTGQRSDIFRKQLIYPSYPPSL